MVGKYPAKFGGLIPVHPSVTAPRVTEMVQRRMSSLDDPGICLACGTDADGVEPDARYYTCCSCQGQAVFGASEILIGEYYHEC